MTGFLFVYLDDPGFYTKQIVDIYYYNCHENINVNRATTNKICESENVGLLSPKITDFFK